MPYISTRPVKTWFTSSSPVGSNTVTASLRRVEIRVRVYGCEGERGEEQLGGGVRPAVPAGGRIVCGHGGGGCKEGGGAVRGGWDRLHGQEGERVISERVHKRLRDKPVDTEFYRGACLANVPDLVAAAKNSFARFCNAICGFDMPLTGGGNVTTTVRHPPKHEREITDFWDCFWLTNIAKTW
ncbi:hypothetical protein K438DRAFT_1776608 [Mycena galopus ATCC 62051]|nr:hypothetical protein K438DRAFT_1776608 [Mycena galopus ATCC 62051]